MSRERSPEQEAHWQAVRRAVLERDGYRCREPDCGETPDRRELDVHHLIRRADGGQDEVSNCITLCDGCHAARHPRMQVALSRRMMERWALRLARWLDRTGELPDETKALDAGLRLFGVDRFRDGQLDAVLGALRGESLLVIRPTGSGKSLCFQLPAVLKGQPATFVLSPLKALMVDQVQGLQRRKLPATFINSDISRDEKEARYRLLESGALSFLYVAPERFNPERVRPEEIARIARQRPNFLVVDEAHLVDRWGDDFRIDYSRIAAIREQLGNPPVLAFTATAGARSQRRIKDSLGIPNARTLASGVDRPNIALIRMPEPSIEKRARIVARLIAQVYTGRVMVFVPTTNVGREVQSALAAAGCELPLYHAKLPKDKRDSIQGRFTGTLDPPLKAVICTSAFSMGLDVPDVRAVVNWQHPSAVEDFLQEFGRGGRDGEPGLSLLFTDGGREAGLLNWMANKTSEDVVKQRKRTPEQAQETLKGKKDRIAEMSRLSLQGERCFRAELNRSLLGLPLTPRRSLPLRILDWVFSSNTRVRPADGCCDVCDPDLADRVRAGAYAPHNRTALRHEAASRAGGVGPIWTWRAGRRRLRWPVLAGAAATVALIGGGVAFLGNSDSTGLTDPSAVARDTFIHYTGAFSNKGEFTAPVIYIGNGTTRACGQHAHPGRADPGTYKLCLFIDPTAPSGRRVTGSYKSNAILGRHDCRGTAKTTGLCS